MEIKDLAGLSEPLKKLIDVIAQGIGAVSEAHLTRRNADAEAYKIRQLAAAMHDARKLLGKVDYENQELIIVSPEESVDEEIMLLAERAESRENYQKIREQSNVEQITGHAAEDLESEQEISEDPVDADWITRFFDMAKHVSNEEMQILWGKILAGEVKQPNTYSLRTLELLRNLSQVDAQVFRKVANFSINGFKSDDRAFVIYPSDNYLEENFGITFSDFLLLQELDLIASNDSLSVTLQGHKYYFVYANRSIGIEKSGDVFNLRFPVKRFTKIGSELLRLVEVEFSASYFDKFVNLLKSNPDIVVKQGVILKRDIQGIYVDEWQEIQ